jgi:hypothetical protein
MGIYQHHIQQFKKETVTQSDVITNMAEQNLLQ